MRWISFQWCNQDGPRVQTHLDNWKESVDGFFFFHTCSFVAASKKVLWNAKWQSLCNDVCALTWVWRACLQDAESLVVIQIRERSRRVTEQPLLFYPFLFLSSFTTNHSGCVLTALVTRRNRSRVFHPHRSLSSHFSDFFWDVFFSGRTLWLTNREGTESKTSCSS